MNKEKIPHYGVRLSDGREVFLGKLNDSYSIIFNRPIKESDIKGLPEYASINNDKVMTQLSISKDAMAALVDLYIKNDYNEVKKTTFIWDESLEEHF